MVFKNSRAVMNKARNDFSAICFWTLFVVQIIFLCLYGYKIYTHLDKMIYLIIYSILAVLSIVSFAIFLATKNKKKGKVIKGTKRGFRIAKYVANATMIIVVLFEYSQVGATDLDIVLTGISIISFILQVGLEIGRVIFEKYSELFMVAIKMDTEPIDTIIETANNLTDAKGSILSIIDSPLQAISNKITKTNNKEESKTEKYVKDLVSNLQKEVEEKKANDRKERQDKKMEDIKSHFNTIVDSIRKKNK